MRNVKSLVFILNTVFILGGSFANAANADSNIAPVLERTAQNFVNELAAGNNTPIYKLSPCRPGFI